jgi:hypothetical protein
MKPCWISWEVIPSTTNPVLSSCLSHCRCTSNRASRRLKVASFQCRIPTPRYRDTRSLELRTIDETGIECSLSKIHLDDFLPANMELNELARTGLDFAFLLRGALLNSRVLGPFRIIISAQLPDQSLNVGLNVGTNCTVRFHRMRLGQEWLKDDLDSYKEEALAVLDFDL